MREINRFHMNPLNIPQSLHYQMVEIFHMDDNCTDIGEFYRYSIRLFNEFMANHTVLRVNARADEILPVREHEMYMDGKALLDEFYEKYGNNRRIYDPRRINLYLTEGMMADINTYRAFYHIVTIDEYVGLAFAWAVKYYELMSDRHETETEKEAEPQLIEHFLMIDGKIGMDRMGRYTESEEKRMGDNNGDNVENLVQTQ